MIEIGNTELLGFHIGNAGENRLYDCKLFIGGECVSDCQGEHIPGLAGYVRSEFERYRNTLNFLLYEADFLCFDDLTQIHNALAHSPDGPVEILKWKCYFLNWQIPLTDLCQAFLIPFRGGLWLTWQAWDDHQSRFTRLDVVKGKRVFPYDLIDNFRECAEAIEGLG